MLDTKEKSSQLEKLLSLHKDKAIKVIKNLYSSRFIDDKMAVLVKQNKGTTFFLSTKGHELIGTVAGLSLTPKKDWALPYYRDRAFALALGSSFVEILGAFLARDVLNHSSGRMMLDHFSDPELKMPCQSSVVGSQFLQACGVAKAVQLSGKDEVVYVSSGEGATSQGDFHEALNFSCLHKLGVVFVVQHNDWAISTPVKDQTAGGSIAKIAKGYEGLQVLEIDGCDYFEVNNAMEKSITKAMSQNGPTVIVAHVPRINAHTCSDDQKKYKDPIVMQEELEKDPITKFENLLLEKEILTQEELEEIKFECQQAVSDAADEAEKIPFPLEATTKVFKSSEEVIESSETLSSKPILMMDGLNHALIEEMQRDSKIVVFGQDVAGNKGGVFGITRTLEDLFGKNRCFNTSLAESTITGVACGLSQAGYVPVVEIQFADYVWTGINQIVNELSSIHYRSNGQWNCPVVIRMPYGGYIQGGPYHSQSIEAIFAHIPGLKIVIPSNAADAKRLLKTAIRDPNPVLFFEHKALYRQHVYCAKEEPSKEALLPFGKANVVKEGKDVTLVAWGMMVKMAFEVANQLENEGISVEIIDLRTLVPLDMETVLTSLKKTNKVIIAHEAAKTCGFGAELATRILEEGFYDLDAPIVRVAGQDCPIPYCLDLEAKVLPQKQDLENSIRKIVAH